MQHYTIIMNSLKQKNIPFYTTFMAQVHNCIRPSPVQVVLVFSLTFVQKQAFLIKVSLRPEAKMSRYKVSGIHEIRGLVSSSSWFQPKGRPHPLIGIAVVIL